MRTARALKVSPVQHPHSHEERTSEFWSAAGSLPLEAAERDAESHANDAHHDVKQDERVARAPSDGFGRVEVGKYGKDSRVEHEKDDSGGGVSSRASHPDFRGQLCGWESEEGGRAGQASKTARRSTTCS